VNSTAIRRRPYYKFRLYVAGETQNSAAAVANLNALCRKRLPDRHNIEIINVFKEPKRALADSIFMTPTLVKVLPGPAKRIVGTLSETQPLLFALGLSPLDE
jgi:circadian clock protein KaiB